MAKRLGGFDLRSDGKVCAAYWQSDGAPDVFFCAIDQALYDGNPHARAVL
jgi:hypothetical protein